MLKRRTKIQKYISVLKKKKLKQNNLQNHIVLQHQIEVQSKEPKVQQSHPMQIQVEQQRQQACWNDPDDPTQLEQVNVGERNKFKKLINFGMSSTPSVDEYERKLGKFYQSKYKRVNWAQEAEDIEERDINDYLNEQIYFTDKKPAIKTIKFMAKTPQKHQSIVSGLDWHKNVMLSCGLDHKIKIWYFQPEQANPQLKLKQQKDIYIQDLPLSNCYYRNNSLLCGSLRKNLVLVDAQKWKSTFITSSFLKEHKTYQNLRVSTVNDYSSIFSDNRVSLLDKNNIYIGGLLANQNIQDVSFSISTPNSVFAVTNDSIYEWDIRKLGIVRMEKKYLGFTCLSASGNSVNIGSKLGTVYIYNANDFANPIENSNLVTHITQIKSNKNGEYSIALSKWKANTIRVIDSMTGKAVGDWPGVKTKVGLPMQAGFNQANYFGVGSSQGYISIYGFSSEMI